MEKFTICIAMYNQMNYIEESLKSVLTQNYKNTEVIIADDCSSDFNLKKINSIIKKYNISNFPIKIIHNLKNLGTVKNLNQCIDISTGKYISFFAADDKLYNESVITNFVKSFKLNDSYNVVTSQCFCYDESLDKIIKVCINNNDADKLNFMSPKKQFVELSKNCIYSSGSTAYKKNFLIKNKKFDEKYRYVEDWAFWLRITRSGEKIYYSNFISLCHRDGGISHSNNKKNKNRHVSGYYKDMKSIYKNEIIKYFYKYNILELMSLCNVLLKKVIKPPEINLKYDGLHSFVICAYKEQKNIEDCIISLINQKLKSPIYISTSTPNEFIKKISKKYNIKLIINDSQSSHSRDFNFAFNQAKTKYVTLCHQDDIYMENFSYNIVKKMEKSKKPIIGFTNYWELKNNKIIKNNKLLFVKRIINFPLLLFKSSKKVRNFTLSLGNAICAPTVTYNKQILKEAIVKSNYKSNIDWISYIEFSKYDGSFVYVKKASLIRRIHKESLTTQVINNNLKQEEDYKIFKQFWKPSIAKLILKIYSRSEKNNITKGDNNE